MVESAAAVQLGESLNGLFDKFGLLSEPSFYSVKAPVFSNEKLKDVDLVLGPEMKSTGELLGLGRSAEEAMEKAMFPNGENIFQDASGDSIVFCSIADREKPESIEIVKALQNKGFQIGATVNTAAYFNKYGIKTPFVSNDLDEIKALIADGKAAAVLNSPNQGRNKASFGFGLRELSVRYKIPLFTCLDTIKAALNLSGRTDQLTVLTLAEYRRLEMITS